MGKGGKRLRARQVDGAWLFGILPLIRLAMDRVIRLSCKFVRV